MFADAQTSTQARNDTPRLRPSPRLAVSVLGSSSLVQGMYAKETMDNHWTLRLLRRWRFPALQFQRWIESRRTFSYEPMLRSELFSAEQMASHGALLARQHHLNLRSSKEALLARLADNEATLASTCRALTTAPISTRRATPAAEW